ncbi:MAG: cation:proton antiporter, partial [bacterium]|nr:cation:proton antiporter [bacterium]
MPINEIATHVRNYLLMAIVVTGIWFLSPVFAIGMDSVISEFQGESQMLFFLTSITLIFALGYLAYELAKPTVIPSFVLAIFVGMAARDVFAHVTNHTALLSMLITTGAVLILFGGGIETPFQQFKQSIGPILSLALIGTIINAFLFSLVLSALASWMNIVLPLPAIVLLGAAIASTDPAAIIPSFGTLFFIKPRVKHIAISESAINDVVGAVLVSIFLAIVLSGTVPESVADAYMMLLKKESLTLIIQTLSVGLSVGCIGFLFFSLWSKWKEHVQIDP